MIQSQPQRNQAPINLDEEYQHILLKVGNSGKYQWFVFCIVIVNYVLIGFSMSGIILSTMNIQFDCSRVDSTWSTQECEIYVCSQIPAEEIEDFPQIQKYQTIATQYGPFYCDQNAVLGEYRGLAFLGGFIGCLFSTLMSDNFSRKKTWLGGILLWLLASIIIFFGKGIFQALFGLFLMIFSCSPIARLAQIYISEITEPKLKQKFISSVLGAFTLGTLFSMVGMEIFLDWRIAYGVCLAIPLFILILVFGFLVVDTPKFIIRGKKPEQAIVGFAWMASINGHEVSFGQKYIEELIFLEQQYQRIQRIYTPIDLFRYKSLRKASVFALMVWFLGDFIFVGPSAIINYIGINNKVNAIFYTSGELLAIPIAILLISKHERKKLMFTALGIGTILNLILSFIQVPAQCNFCSEGMEQMILVALSRTCIYFHFATLHNLQTEFYPVSIRNIGLGIPYSVSNLAAVFSQYIFMKTYEEGVNPFHIIFFGSLVSMLLVKFLPQTFYLQSKNHIQEIIQKRQSSDDPQFDE